MSSPGLGLAKAEIFAPGIPAAIAFGMGVVLGNVANILMFQALAATSNQGLVMALVNTSSVITFLGAFAGAAVAPRWFAAVRFDGYHLLGIVLTIAGVAIIAARR